jgi:hypothetical protein
LWDLSGKKIVEFQVPRTYALTKSATSVVSMNEKIFRRSLINKGIQRRIIPMLS